MQTDIPSVFSYFSVGAYTLIFFNQNTCLQAWLLGYSTRYSCIHLTNDAIDCYCMGILWRLEDYYMPYCSLVLWVGYSLQVEGL